MPSTLLALPAELRNAIYTYALTSPTRSLTFIPSTRRFDVSTIGAGGGNAVPAFATEQIGLPHAGF
jgi:hypothetical protein